MCFVVIQRNIDSCVTALQRQTLVVEVNGFSKQQPVFRLEAHFELVVALDLRS